MPDKMATGSTTEGQVTSSHRPRKRAPAWDGPWDQFKPLSPRDAVVETILNLIRNGDLRPGMRLPSEPQLSRMIGVSRSSVREASRTLEARGLLSIKRGQGTYVREVGGAVADSQMLLLLADHQALENLIEVRLVLEPLIVRLAAERATGEDIAAMRAAVAEMRRAPDHEAHRPPHLAFHEALAEATHNILLTKLWGLISLFLRDSPLAKGTIPPTRPNVHDEIFAAVETHNADAALAAMHEHIADMVRALELPPEKVFPEDAAG